MKRFAFILLIAAASMGFFRWGVDIEVVCGTNITALTFGADSIATGGYDPYIDVPYFTIPGGGYGYFPIDDSLHPGYTMLSTDYRSPSHEKIVWGFYLEAGANFVVRWELSDLPDSGEISIGAYNVDSLPNLVVDDWQDMRTVDSIAIFILGGQITAVGSPIFGIGEIPPPPNDFRIGAYPNPFNSAVSISVGEGLVPSRIEIFDIAGRMVAELSHLNKGGCPEGTGGILTWQPDESFGSGVYLVRVITHSGAEVTKRVVFLK